MKKECLLFIFMIIFIHLPHVVLTKRQNTDEERLVKDLFDSYEPTARGVNDVKKTVTVNVDFMLLRIDALDEKTQALITTGLIIADWYDARLTWDPKQYGDLEDIVVMADQIWLPEFAVMNGADEFIPNYKDIRAQLHYDGKLHWEPGGIFKTSCKIGVTNFPFDRQECSLVIGAYSYISAQMNITNVSDHVITSHFQTNGEWEIEKSTAEWAIVVLPCCPDKGYSNTLFTIYMYRRSMYYIVNILLPCLMLSVLILAGFFIPPDAGEKISLGISVLLAFSVFQIMITEKIPRTSLVIPVMVKYLTVTMFLGTISICMTVLVLRLHNTNNKYPVPQAIRKLVLVNLAKILFVKTTALTSMQFNRFGAKVKSQVCASPGLVRKNSWKSRNRNQISGPSARNFKYDDDLDEVMLMTMSSHNVHIAKMAEPNMAINDPEKYAKIRQNSLSSSEEDSLKELEINEWQEMACVLDRLFFWVLFITMTVSTLSLFMTDL